MSLRGKVIAILLFSTIIVLVGDYLFIRANLKNDFLEIEAQEIEKDVNRIVSALELKKKALNTIAQDYAGWDDTYNFIQDPTSSNSYLDSNYNQTTFEGLNINYVALFDLSFNKVFELYVSEDGNIEQTPNYLNKYLEHAKTDARSHVDLVVENETSVLVSMQPLLTSQKEGPVKGYLIMSQVVNDVEWDDFAKDLQVDLNKAFAQTINNPKQLSNNIGVYGTVSFNKDHAQTIIALQDYKDDLLYFSLNSKREFFAKGTELEKVLLLAQAIGGALTILAVYVLLDFAFIRKIKGIRKQLESLRNNPNTKKKLMVPGNDEIAQTAKEVNYVLEAIDKIQDKLENTNSEVEVQVKQRTKELTYEKSKLLSSIEDLPIAFFFLNTINEISLVNKEGKKLLEERVNYIELERFFVNNFRLYEMIEKATKEHAPINIDEQHIDGKVFNVNIIPIFSNNDSIGTLLTLTDITDQIAINRAKQELFVIASHELKTPLSVILGNLSMISSKVQTRLNDTELNTYLEDLTTASNRLKRIITSILNVGMLEEGKLNIETEQTNIIALIKEVIATEKAEAEKKGLTLLDDLGDQETLLIKTAPKEVKDIIESLITNAIKYTKQGYIRVSIGKEGNFLSVNVCDTGAGISDENKVLLFRKFQQAGQSIYAREVTQGVGLGLYASKLLAHALGGDLTLKSSILNEGTVFELTLPLTEEA